MRLSAPIFRLKHKAKRLAREESMPLHEALNRVARGEGFTSWSLLASRASGFQPALELLAKFNPGDLVMLGARPRQGKTLLGLALLAEALQAGRNGTFFTLECTEAAVLERLRGLGINVEACKGRFQLDCSDMICAGHVIERSVGDGAGDLIVIDYLQVLDQQRDKPPLSQQLSALKAFAVRSGTIVVCLAQIDRSFELSGRALPELGDVRVPNPVDLALFNKACFLNDGKMRVDMLD